MIVREKKHERTNGGLIMGKKRAIPNADISRKNRYTFPIHSTPQRIDGGFYDLTDDFIGEMCLYSETDPAGSYTGVPRDDDTPVQDADDL